MDGRENNYEVKFCIKCGAGIIPGTKFCPRCGAAVVRPAVTAGTPADTVIPDEGKSPAEQIIAENDVSDIVNGSYGSTGDEMPKSVGPEMPVIETIEPETPDNADYSADVIGDRSTAEQPKAGAEDRGAETSAYGAYAERPGAAARQAVDDEFIRQMRAFEAAKREQEQAKKTRSAAVTRENTNASAKRGGVPGWLLAVIVIAAVIVTALFTGVIVAKLSSGDSNLSRSRIENIVDEYISNNPSLGGKKGTKPGSDTNIGGETVPAGSQVTINIEGDSTSVASAVYAKCAQSVVGIGIYGKTSANPWAQQTAELISSGSGVIYKEDGYIITNHHVIDDAIDDNNKLISGYEIRVYTDDTLGSYYTASVVGADATSDLALIKIEEKGLIPIEFEDIDNVGVGDVVFSLGCPGGLEFMGTLSSGVIGGINKNLLTEDGYAFDLILTDAAINPGISGGALVNAKGKLVGICELKIIETNFESMGFAISTDTVKKISEALYKDGKVVRPALGVAVNTNYGPQEANESGAPAGAWISEVTKGSAADKAGIKANMIITEVNGVAVYDYVSLRTQLLKYTVGEKVEIKAYVYSGNDVKNGTYKIFNVTLQVLDEN